MVNLAYLKMEKFRLLLLLCEQCELPQEEYVKKIVYDDEEMTNWCKIYINIWFFNESFRENIFAVLYNYIFFS